MNDNIAGPSENVENKTKACKRQRVDDEGNDRPIGGELDSEPAIEEHRSPINPEEHPDHRELIN